MSTTLWPESITLLRHGETEANVAQERAERRHDEMWDIGKRDADMLLTERGALQAQSAALWFSNKLKPTVVISSPYVRADQTTAILSRVAGLDKHKAKFIVDERLREQDFGVLSGYTFSGLRASNPFESYRREQEGWLYWRPPGGESWCDVILRLRSLLSDICRDYPNERILLVCHGHVILCLRYILEGLSESRLLQLREEGVPNCSFTDYMRSFTSQSVMELVAQNVVMAPAADNLVMPEPSDRQAPQPATDSSLWRRAFSAIAHWLPCLPH